MKLKMFVYILLAVGIGFFLGNMFFREYDDSLSVFKESEYYFLSLGSFKTVEEVQEASKAFPNYAYEEDGGYYKVYIAITSSDENIEKIKGLYNDIKNNISIETKAIPDNSFTEILLQYDELLAKTTEKDAIETIIKQVLEKYKEL